MVHGFEIVRPVEVISCKVLEILCRYYIELLIEDPGMLLTSNQEIFIDLSESVF